MLHSDILEPCSERLDLAESRLLRTSIADYNENATTCDRASIQVN